MNYPIGRLQWTVQNNESAEFGICGLLNGQVHILTFSDCHPNKFSCNNGQCIGKLPFHGVEISEIYSQGSQDVFQ